MFIGEYSHNLDSKGRIIIPSKFRDDLHESFILTRGFDSCLTIFSYEQWKKLIEEISKLPSTKKSTRQYIRVITSKASECSLDNQGRIVIPSFLSKEVNIKKECIIVGVNDHIEIWDKDNWDAYINDASDSFEDVAENLDNYIND